MAGTTETLTLEEDLALWMQAMPEPDEPVAAPEGAPPVNQE